MLEIEVAGILVHTFFHDDKEIELDIDPREVNESNVGTLTAFLARLGDLLGKVVGITNEGSHDSVLLAYDPHARALVFPESGSQR